MTPLDTVLLSTLLSLPMTEAPPTKAALRLVSRAEPAANDDARAVAALRTGDLDALGELYDLHHAAVRGFAMRFLGDAAAAEDLVQEVFLALPDALTRYRGEAPLRSFLVAMAANQSKNHVRAAARRRATAARAGREPEPRVPSPDEDLDRAQLAALLQGALDELGHDHRVAFVLCEVEERTSPEVAAMLGIPEATVRTRLFHAKKRLRELLGGAR